MCLTLKMEINLNLDIHTWIVTLEAVDRIDSQGETT